MALTKVTTDGITDDAVTLAKVADNSVSQGALVSDAVTSVKILDSAVIESKLANNAVATAKVADNAITTTKIADENITLAKLEHGTSSNDGKFLRANNGADPTFETVTGTTINSNANNRVITGSGTANTLNGEANLFFDGSQLGVGTTSPYQYSIAHFESTNGIVLAGSSQSRLLFRHTGGGTDLKMMDIQSSNGVMKFRTLADTTSATNRMVIDSSGKVGINETSPQQTLHVHNDTAYQGILVNGNGAPRVGFARSTTTTGEWSVGIDGTNGNDFVINNSNDNSNRKLILSSTGVTSAGTLTAGGSCTAFDNFIVATAGKGLSFAATSDASGMSSEILDDYEEGTFTPTNSTVGLNSANGRYTKVGNVVHFHLRAVFANNGSAIAAYIDGLPYTSAANWGGSYPHSLTIGYATGNHIQFALLSGGSDRIYLYDKNGNSVQLTHFDNDDVRVGGSYIVA